VQYQLRAAFVTVASLAALLSVPGQSNAQVLYARPYSGSYFRNTNYGTGIYLEPNVQYNLAFVNLRSAYPGVNQPLSPINFYRPVPEYFRPIVLAPVYSVAPRPEFSYFGTQPSTVNYGAGYFYQPQAPTTSAYGGGGYYTTASDMNYQPAVSGAYFSQGYYP
jgi:hypothetical protein